MNINRNNNNNRRRGRNSSNTGNRGGSGGGGNPANRIDSRARGNAPQMLEKYRKLAHDASLNDDRVQTEYYLQFADHYFRVIADIKAQKDEAQARSGRDREQSSDDGDDDYHRDDQRSDRQDDQRSDRQDDQQRGNRQPRGQQGQPRDDDYRQDRSRSDNEDTDDGGSDKSPEHSDADRPDDNPFTRESRQGRPAKTRARRQPQSRDQDQDDGEDADVPRIEALRLPPAINRTSRNDDDTASGAEAAADDAAAKLKPKPRPRAKLATKPARTRRAASDDQGDADGEALEAVN